MPPPYIPSLEVVKKKAILSMRLSDYFCAHCVCLRPFGLFSYSCVNGFIGQAKINRLCIINQKGRSRTLLQANSFAIDDFAHTKGPFFSYLYCVASFVCWQQDSISISSGGHHDLLFSSFPVPKTRRGQNSISFGNAIFCYAVFRLLLLSLLLRIKKLSKSKNFPQLPQAFYLICVSLASASASVDIVHFQTV